MSFQSLIPSHIAGSMIAIFFFSFSLFACSPQVSYHGHIFSDSDLQQIQKGHSKEQVRLAFGTPDTTSTIGGGIFYYISSTQKKLVAFYKPTVIDRRVLAIYFDENEKVKQIANYGLKDGKFFDFISRKTPSHGQDAPLLKQLFRNLGTKQFGNDDPF